MVVKCARNNASEWRIAKGSEAESGRGLEARALTCVLRRQQQSVSAHKRAVRLSWKLNHLFSRLCKIANENTVAIILEPADFPT